MKYFGNFKEYIPNNLIKTILEHPYKGEGPNPNDPYEEVKVWQKAGYNFDNIKWISYTSEMIDVPVSLPGEFGNVIEIWYTKLNPGNMFPLHRDVFSYTDNNLVRFTMLLLDQQPGHVFCYNNKILTDYRAGDVFVFDNPYMWHGAVNIGLTPRITMQISAEIEDFNFDTLKTV